jgi:hypothetical protein
VLFFFSLLHLCMSKDYEWKSTPYYFAVLLSMKAR